MSVRAEMRCAGILLAVACVATPLPAQEMAQGPANEKAQKTFKEANEHVREHRYDSALDGFKKADKQDDGHCLACQKQMIKYGIELRDWKPAELAAEEMVAEAQSEKDKAVAHFQSGIVWLNEGLDKHKEEYFARTHEEMTKVLAVYENSGDALFVDGRALAYLKQDDAASARFEQFAKLKGTDDTKRQRALRYIREPELARARMAPPFAVTTLDGQRISLDDLQGKVVLLDFWATWCEPCREALPHLRDVAKKFQGQLLVVLSVSFDSEEQKWKEFIEKNQMTWPQYRDGSFGGPIAKLFAVHAIPHTFTIDADGVLQDEHIGDAAIEGKLKKLLTRARELQPSQ